ncbi:MAG TPA: hypothetical protein IAA29_12180 [Candidatus Paenibacillus intestinavium]|nr:hypothetical protein [Candidatus Paenibacillus intestinavium]
MTLNKQNSFLYNVEILIENEHHAIALQQLIEQLNKANFLDYKITSGIELGDVIAARKAKAKTTKPIAVTVESNEYELGLEAFRQCKDHNKLVRLIVNRGLGIKLSIPCRVINIDETDQIVTIYHVDEKQVYTFRLNEIEDFIEV